MQSNFLLRAGGCLLLAGQISGLLLHVGTIIIAYQLSGFVAAVLSFIFVGVAEIYWAIALWWRVGFLNIYTLAAVAVLAMFLLFGLFAYLTSLKEPE